jgi:hypothetical protein
MPNATLPGSRISDCEVLAVSSATLPSSVTLLDRACAIALDAPGLRVPMCRNPGTGPLTPWCRCTDPQRQRGPSRRFCRTTDVLLGIWGSYTGNNMTTRPHASGVIVGFRWLPGWCVERLWPSLIQTKNHTQPKVTCTSARAYRSIKSDTNPYNATPNSLSTHSLFSSSENSPFQFSDFSFPFFSNSFFDICRAPS